MLDLARLTSFVAVVDAGSFTAAAKALGLTKAAVSQHVRKLEDDLACALIVRSSRRVAPTEAGLRLHGSGAELLAQAARLEAQAKEQTGLSGTVRIATTNEYLSVVLAPLLAEFLRRHPRVRLEAFGGPDLTDVVAERMDLAIRFGHPASSALRATKLTHSRLVVVAAPALLTRFGIPAHPSELATLPWILHRRHPNPWLWRRGDENVSVTLESRLTTDAVDANRQLALDGEAVIMGAEWRLRRDIEEGRLVRLIPDWTAPSFPIYAVRPPNAHLPARVKALIDHLKEALS